MKRENCSDQSIFCFNPFCVIMGWMHRRECIKKQSTEDMIMAKLSELAVALAAVDAKLGKAQAEIAAQIAALQAALVDVEIPAEAQALLSAIAAKAQALDDIVPDAPVV
jgi:hypothetical protein